MAAGRGKPLRVATLRAYRAAARSALGGAGSPIVLRARQP
jgi:hypothetical protein